MIRFSKNLLSAGLSGLALGWLTLSAIAGPPVARPANLPLYFEINQGQFNVSARFIARGPDYQFMISPAEALIGLRGTGDGPAVVRLQFAGANAQAPVRGAAELPGKVNYLTGSDPAQWRTGMPMFSRVSVNGLYPGIDLVYYGNQRQLEYDFTVAPGANPLAIVMHFDGTDNITISPQGELILSLAGGEIRQPKPLIYQTMDGMRTEIKGGYRLVDAHTVAFAVGNYDRSQPLVIDPVFEYSTYFGGSAGEIAYAVALDTNANVYMAGQTLSQQFSPSRSFSTAGAFQTNFAGGSQTGDAFVFKLDASTGNPAYITYLGGSADDAAYSLAVDSAGHAYIAGATDSPDFPITNAIPGHANIQGKPGSLNTYPTDAFVAELDASGSNLIYSTFLGGVSSEAAFGIAVDSADNAFVTGFTYSTNFPTTPNAMQPHLACTNSFSFNANAFITEIAANGQSLVYSTYFGGTNLDTGKSIAVDTNGFIYVAGFTSSTNFPTTNAFQQTLNRSTNLTSRSSDAFVAKLDPTGTSLVYSTLLGSTNNDVANGIAVDNTGAAYVTGWTVSSNFPNTVGTTIPGLQSYLATNTLSTFLVTNAFLTKITNGTQAGIAWSALFGGNGVDVGNAVALDPAGDVFVTGSASSINFPTFNVPTLAPYTNSGQSDAFVIAFSATATNLLYSTYLGGKNSDYGYGIAVNTNGDAYVVGQTFSQNFPIQRGRFPTLNGTSDGFLGVIQLTMLPPVITTQPISQTNSVGSSVTLSVFGEGTQPFYFQWQKDGVSLKDGGSISGATNNEMTIDPAQTTNSGFYSLIITNYGGAVTSSYAILGVTNIPPVITTEPDSQTNGVGTTVTFAVFGDGTEPLSFHWQFEGTNLVNGTKFSGATNNVLTVNNIQLTNAGNYAVVITNMAGSATSSNALLTVQTVPIIIAQPATNQSIAIGSSTIFKVTAIGTVPLMYQWWNGTNKLVNGTFSGVTISGVTSTNLIISNVQMTNSGNYTVIVTNVAGFATSSNAVLTVTNIPPGITPPQPPAFQTNGVGTTVTLAITATGTTPLSYQWQFNGTNLVNGGNISGATTNVLKLTNVQLTNSGNYMLGITNNGGSTNSSVFNLTVQASPLILVQPTSQTNAVGSNVSLAVTAVGTVPLTYHWQLNGTNLVNGGQISGATTNVLFITNAQTTNSSTNYTIVITNVAGSVTSSVAILSVTNQPPNITLQPTNQAWPVSSNVTMTVSATGTAPLSYQWQMDGTNLANGGQISGATTNVLKITGVQATNSGSYTVIVTNFGGSATSSNAVLTVTNIPPTITLQPTNQTVSMGTLVSIVANATGPGPLSYQWQVDGTNLLNGGNLTGATTNILKFSNVQTNNSSTNYSVIVTNLGGAVTSSVVSLTVLGVPVITLQPETNQSMAVGSTATFAVTATGAVPLSYRWQLNGTNLINGGSISGVTTTNLIIGNAQTNNSSPNYTIVITNLAGSVTSLLAGLTVTNIPPAITVQPTNQLVGVGTNVTLVVIATGTAPLSYHWQLEGTNLVNGGHFSGVTTNVLTISAVQLTNAGNYSVVITNYGGSVISSNALLTVQDSPTIVTQPASQTNSVGSAAVFTVNAIGTVPLSYQWWNGTNKLVNGTFSGVTFSGATASQLSIFNAQTTNSTGYTVIVSNSVGSITSSNAVLLVTNIAPVITLQPTNQAWPAGSNVFLVVTVTGTAPLSYHWQLNGTYLTNGGSLSGATTNVLKISNAQTNNSGTNYSVIVTNFGGSVTSSAVSLTVASSPVILTQPASQTVVVGSTPSFAVTAVGILPLSYRWQASGMDLTNGAYNGGFISGATTANLTFGNVQVASSTNYAVVITNLAGSVTSLLATLTVTNIPPSITLQPTNQTVTAGSTATLVVRATGTPPFTYQWQVVQAGVTNLLVDGGQFNGATNATLTIDDVQPANNGSYSVTVMNPGGSIISSNAVLTVLMAPPSFGQIIAAEGGGFILSGSGGTSNGIYKVRTSSDLLVPLTNWSFILTDQFDSDGNFIFTNTTPTNAPQLFYILQLP